MPSLPQPQRRSLPPLPTGPRLHSSVLALSSTANASSTRLGRILLPYIAAISVSTPHYHPVPQSLLLPPLYLFLFTTAGAQPPLVPLSPTIAAPSSHYSDQPSGHSCWLQVPCKPIT
ncbi:hypothetical protein BHE74_00021877 [Ensete ventricosum]|uniref:Uncharacterized protein n=1 Tax=Ensete ventricosum TaxID=4639 RepID=A0A426ZI90_ENSVE|nr:hypothetical protein B296_00001186 [Ensete ventricosum]RWW70439.1 hypothetical protein BHE74_00021877 [Ensete ventricosum]